MFGLGKEPFATRLPYIHSYVERCSNQITMICHVSIFTHRALRKYMDQFNASGDLLVEQLSKMADGKTEVNLLDEVNRITLDAIAKVVRPIRPYYFIFA